MVAVASEPERFRDLARRSGRDRAASGAAVAILKADSRVAQTIERALLEAGLTLPQFNVLMELASTIGGALPLHELNRRLISTPPNTSYLSNKMEQARLVTKVRDRNDSRVVILSITEHGWRSLDEAATLVFRAERKLFASFTREELRLISTLLARLTASVP